MSTETAVAGNEASIPVELAQQWFGYLNSGTAQDAVATSRQRVWWECAKGHLFAASIWERVFEDGTCPYCAATEHKPQAGRSLAERHPHLGAQWHERNQGLGAHDVSPAAKLYAWWRCESGHEYQATVRRRVKARGECPSCAKQGWSAPAAASLQECYPATAVLWSQARNGLSAEQVSASTPGLYWWECSFEHAWTARIVAQLSAEGCWSCVSNGPVSARSVPTRRPSERRALDAPAVPAPWDWDQLSIEHEQLREQESAVSAPEIAVASKTEGPRRVHERKRVASSKFTASKLRAALRSCEELARVFPTAHTLTLRTSIRIAVCGVSSTKATQVVVVELDAKRGARDLSKTMSLLEVGVAVVRVLDGAPELDLIHPQLLQLPAGDLQRTVASIGQWVQQL